MFLSRVLSAKRGERRVGRVGRHRAAGREHPAPSAGLAVRVLERRDRGLGAEPVERPTALRVDEQALLLFELGPGERMAMPLEAVARLERLPQGDIVRNAGGEVARYNGEILPILRTGEYGDGRLGEIFIDMHKEGAAYRSMLNCFSMLTSIALQYGVPLEVYVSKFSHMRFEPSGPTNDPDIRAAKSIVDYVFRWMGKKFLTVDQQEEIGILSPEVRARLAAAYSAGAPTLPEFDERPTPGQTALFNSHEDAIECSRCGGRMVRAGTCYTCRDCGTNTGCS